MRPDTVVCWKWKPQPGYRSTFSAEAVNVLRRRPEGTVELVEPAG